MNRNPQLTECKIVMGHRVEFKAKERKIITFQPTVKLLPGKLIVADGDFLLHDMKWSIRESNIPKAALPMPCGIFHPDSKFKLPISDWFGREKMCYDILMDVENISDKDAEFAVAIMCLADA